MVNETGPRFSNKAHWIYIIFIKSDNISISSLICRKGISYIIDTQTNLLSIWLNILNDVNVFHNLDQPPPEMDRINKMSKLPIIYIVCSLTNGQQMSTAKQLLTILVFLRKPPNLKYDPVPWKMNTNVAS